MPFVKVYAKKRVRFAELTFNQQEMLKLGTVAVSSLVNRARLGLNLADAPAKPLRQSYARVKRRLGLIPRRDLTGSGFWIFRKSETRRSKSGKVFIGHMLDNLSVRTVSNNAARATLTSPRQRLKALANQRRELWLGFSPKNIRDIAVAFRRLFFDPKVAKLGKAA